MAGPVLNCASPSNEARFLPFTKARGAVAIAIVIAAAAVAISQCREISLDASGDQNAAGFFQYKADRLARLREELAGRAVVGFASQQPPWLGERMMLQSMVAPTLVIDSDN